MRASERVNRSLAGTIGAGGLGYGLLEVPEIVHQAPLAAAWWTAFAVVAIFGSCLALICLAAFAPLANLRAGLGVLAGAPVAAFLTFPLASR